MVDRAHNTRDPHGMVIEMAARFEAQRERLVTHAPVPATPAAQGGRKP